MPKRKSPQLPLEQYEPGQYPPGGFVRTEEYPDGVHVRANAKVPFAILLCAFSGFCIDRFGSKTLVRGPRSKVRRSFIDVGRSSDLGP
jgi:hypothetical protein